MSAATEIYNKTESITKAIGKIYTDGNSCYTEAFIARGVDDLLEISVGKTKTHMIEATNSSIRDNLARFNRRTKRYSKTLEMLDYTMLLFSHSKKFNGNFKTI